MAQGHCISGSHTFLISVIYSTSTVQIFDVPTKPGCGFFNSGLLLGLPDLSDLDPDSRIKHATRTYEIA